MEDQWGENGEGKSFLFPSQHHMHFRVVVVGDSTVRMATQNFWLCHVIALFVHVTTQNFGLTTKYNYISVLQLIMMKTLSSFGKVYYKVAFMHL